MRKFLKILVSTLAILLLLGGVFYYTVSLPSVQTWISQKVTNYLSAQLKTTVSIRKVEIHFFNHLRLDDILIKDRANDTLFSARQLDVAIVLFQPFQNTLRLGKMQLNDPVVYLHRAKGANDFNFRFMLDALASKDTTASEKKPPKLAFSDIWFHNCNMHMLDEANKKDVLIYFKDMAMEGEKLNLELHQLSLKKLAFTNANVAIRVYTPNPDSLPPNPNDTIHEDLDKAVVNMINTAGWDIRVAHLTVNNSTFKYTHENYPLKPRGIDFHRIEVKEVNIDITNARIEEDTIFARVNKLTAKERSGFVIKNLSTNAVIAPNHMQFYQLHAITGESEITDYYSMEYHSLADFGSYEDRVIMTGHFTGARVSINDIDYFARALKDIDHNIVHLTGDARGTVNNLKGKNLDIAFGKHSDFKGNIEFKDLIHSDATFISAQVTKMRSNAEDLESIYPYLKYPSNMTRLGTIWFTGRFDGFFKDFVADGQMLSALGRVNSDINMKIDDDNKAHYSGNFSTTDFDLGKWLNNDSIGRVTMLVYVEGSGLKLSNLDAYGKGVINSITAKSYVYKDINFDGTFQKSQFNGFFTVKDENLDMDFNGDINLAQEPPVFKFRSTVYKANLQPLHISSVNYKVSTSLQLDLVGDRIDNMNGHFYANDTRAYRDDSLYTLDSLDFISYDQGNQKTLLFKSDFADASVSGNFNFRDLPNALRSFFSYYFEPQKHGPQLPKDTIRQDFKFEANIRNTKNFTRLLVKELYNIEGAKIKGFFNSQGNSFALNVNIPGLNYHNFRMADIRINSGSKYNVVSLTSSIDTVYYKDSMFTRLVQLDAGIKLDTMLFRFVIQDSTSPNRLDLKGSLTSDFNMASMTIMPSLIFLNGDQWQINGGNSIYIDKDNLVIKDLQMVKGPHFLRINTEISEGHNHLNIGFANMKLKEVLPELSSMSGYDIEGTANGNVTIQDIMQNPKFSGVVELDSFKVNKDLLGDLKVAGTYRSDDSLVNITGKFKGTDNDIDINGNFNPKNPDNYLDLVFSVNQLHLPHIEKFVSDYVTKIKGDINGNLHMTGTFARPDFSGDITGHNIQATVNYLNTTYFIDEGDILLRNGIVDLGQLHIKDVKGNKAVGSGTITHDHLRNFALNIDVHTDMFQFLNTTSRNNSSFYGPVYAKGLVQFQGPIGDLNILATATTMKGTDFVITEKNDKDVDRYSFYRFTAKDTSKAKKTSIKADNDGVNLNFDIDVTRDAHLKLIISTTEGDQIQTRGHGNMKIVYDKGGEFIMTGRYEIDQGQYQFNMQNVITKNFDMTQGSEILWTGDPYDPRLSILAEYKLRAAPYDLVEDLLTDDVSMQQAKTRVPVFLQLKLGGSLETPDIRFDVRVPDVDQNIRSVVDSKLSLIRQDQNEMNKQVVGLLILNRFLPSQSSSASTNNSIAQGATNTVSDFIGNQLSLYLSDWVSKFITEVQLDIKYQNYQNSLATGTATASTTTNADFENRRELQLALTKTLFNDRVEFDIGGNFDFGQSASSINSSSGGGSTTAGTPSTAPTSNNVTGDFEIRYNITADGRIKVKVFRKGEYDMFQERNLNKTGAGISYRREFDSIKDLFKERKEKKLLKKEKRQLEENIPAEPKKQEVQPAETMAPTQ